MGFWNILVAPDIETAILDCRQEDVYNQQKDILCPKELISHLRSDANALMVFAPG